MSRAKRATDPRCMRLDRAIAGLPPVVAKAPADILPFVDRGPLVSGAQPVIVTRAELAEHAARIETLQGTIAAREQIATIQAERIASLTRCVAALEQMLTDSKEIITRLLDAPCTPALTLKIKALLAQTGTAKS